MTHPLLAAHTQLDAASLADAVNFDAAGLVPAIVQDVHTGRVLMLAWMDRESLRRTIALGESKPNICAIASLTSTMRPSRVL